MRLPKAARSPTNPRHCAPNATWLAAYLTTFDVRQLKRLRVGSKKNVTAIPGAAYFHHADSFAMIRGGHIDICVLGAMQVSASGDLANWSTGESDAIPAVGGAMDLVAGVKKIFVLTEHTTRTGEPKLVAQCTFPLTGKSVVDRIYTNLAVIDVTPTGLAVVELAPGVTFDHVRERTGAPLIDRTSGIAP